MLVIKGSAVRGPSTRIESIECRSLPTGHWMSLMNNPVVIREVGLRDGLQAIARVLPTAQKLEWIRAAHAAQVMPLSGRSRCRSASEVTGMVS